ncbi:MAG: hypothetical protein CVV27_07135 [Candidatus Melainabacteria bacterium HGW-Melainabacteria-1]|nr:MAG: hypothetical protein CVV27_07135 [Candidatus Melainabacteria bacterium HGW-Melainabacteria-1]
MSSYHDLKQFITETMVMSHIYQPVIIKTLLESGGHADKLTLAQKVHEFMPTGSVSDYQKKLDIHPKDVLTKHGIVKSEGEVFQLTLPPDTMSQAEKQELIQLCEDKIQNYLAQQAQLQPSLRKVSWSRIQSPEPVLKAIEEFDKFGREAFLKKYGCSASTKFFLIHDGKSYDIKALAAASWSFAFPQEDALTCNEFSSGDILINFFNKLGFDIFDESRGVTANLEKEYFHPILQKFLDQAKQEPIDLKKSHYPKTFSGHRLEVSFGAGNAANIPWIALLKDEQKVSNGIYPVYLLYKPYNTLILAYGLSETQPPQHKWQLPENCQTIKSYFQTNLNQQPKRYGGSYVFKAYDLNYPPSEEQIEQDLNELLTEYERTLSEEKASTTQVNLSDATSALIKTIRQTGFHYEPWQIANFFTALKTKPFAILAGISGTGKSKLPTLVGELTGAKVELIAVRPDWTDSSDVIGYQNLQDTFVKGQLLQLAEQAQSNPERMHICILDEMNLARVEQYFAEVLSLIEDRRLNEGGYRSHYPLTKHEPEIFFPANLLLVGTVNMDETTHGFSKKVLDRAFTLEMSDIDLNQWRSSSPTRPEPTFWPTSFWQPIGLRLADLQALEATEEQLIETTVQLLNELNRFLRPAQLQVGYRVRDEICLYLLHARQLESCFETQQGQAVNPLDLAILMKILPRIQGSSLAIREVLRNLLSWSTGSKQDDLDESVEQWKRSGRPQQVETSPYPRTAARLMMMNERYLSEGFTSYWL